MGKYFEKIIKKKVWRNILYLFLDSLNNKYSFSDVVGLTKSSPTNVKNALNTLKNSDILLLEKLGNKTIYSLNTDNFYVRHLVITYAWARIYELPQNVQKCIKTLYNRFIKQRILSIYLFGSAVEIEKPRDVDLAVIYEDKKDLEKIWLEIIKDFEENIECHFYSKEDFIDNFKQGNYSITSTLITCRVLYDNNFIFNFLKQIPAPTKDFLSAQIKKIQTKLEKCFELYRKKKHNECEAILTESLNDFLRIFISSKTKIPGPKHKLLKQAKNLGLNINKYQKSNLWGKLEWMEYQIKIIKRAI